MSKKFTRLLTASALFCAAGVSGALAASPFELGMVIKSTTNPYYNATLAGAKIAAEETGGKVANYGPTGRAQKRRSTLSIASPNAVCPPLRSRRAIRTLSFRQWSVRRSLASRS